MKTENINHVFLDGVLDGSHEDVYYHFGVTSSDPILDELCGIKAVILAGTGERITEFADRWSELNGGSKVSRVIAFPKESRFVTRYTAGVLFASHGMGMASASIALQELMRLVFFLKRGDLKVLDQVFWCRVGTSGGVGLPSGTVVVSSEGLMADLLPYRLLRGGDGEYWFDGRFPVDTHNAIIAANECIDDLTVMSGRTVSGNEFFLEQFRLDGAVCLETPATKTERLRWLDENGVCNIEMEGAMIAGYLNYWGFSKFAMICCILLNRLEGDQITATPQQLRKFSNNSVVVLFNYLMTSLLGS
ncbi:uridine phosphorylase [Mycobacterium uberis]|uniref:Uridine phosphorylase n=1 Tax=Mycobacterium uberis TaxID=2162698 RepID=A0A3E1HC96_9MYCO|nr:uridine phosphorylase [Mycobacterium uberis]RFD24068.1 uridine phosphorylase [Mycobacterium uberis]